jgi:hypothetical protein
MKDKNKVVYQITIEDVQEVALQELDRELTEEEVKNLLTLLPKEFLGMMRSQMLSMSILDI